MIASASMITSRPRVGPLGNGVPSGSCRWPVSTPGVSAGISAQVIRQVHTRLPRSSETTIS